MPENPHLMFEAFPGQVTPEKSYARGHRIRCEQGAGGILHLMHDGVVKPFPSIPAISRSFGRPALAMAGIDGNGLTSHHA